MTRLTLSQQLTTLQEQLATTNSLLMVEQDGATRLREQLLRGQKDLEAAHSELATLRDAAKAHEAIVKELASTKGSNTYNNQRADKAEGELEQCHAVLDGVEGAPGRDYESTVGSYTSAKTRNVVTRLAGAFLSIAKTGGVK